MHGRGLDLLNRGFLFLELEDMGTGESDRGPAGLRGARKQVGGRLRKQAVDSSR